MNDKPFEVGERVWVWAMGCEYLPGFWSEVKEKDSAGMFLVYTPKGEREWRTSVTLCRDPHSEIPPKPKVKRWVTRMYNIPFVEHQAWLGIYSVSVLDVDRGRPIQNVQLVYEVEVEVEE